MKWILAICATFLTPLIAFAVVPQSAAPSLKIVADRIIDVINILIPLVFAVAVFGFLWGITNNFFLKSGSPEGQKAAKDIALWGIVALFVMASIWGILKVIQNTFFGQQ